MKDPAQLQLDLLLMRGMQELRARQQSLEMAFQIARVFGVPLDEVFQYPETGEDR